jgi:hypothetical protein
MMRERRLRFWWALASLLDRHARSFVADCVGRCYARGNRIWRELNPEEYR